VYQLPDVGDGVTRAITGGWQISGILSARSGAYYTVNSGTDVALIGQCCGTIGSPFQRANQVLDDPFMPNRSFAQWLNPAAFQSAAPGTFGTMPLDAIQAVPRWNIDTAVSRSFKLGADRQIQLRLENVQSAQHRSRPATRRRRWAVRTSAGSRRWQVERRLASFSWARNTSSNSQLQLPTSKRPVVWELGIGSWKFTLRGLPFRDALNMHGVLVAASS
jgi:hypothetical protein